MPQQRERVCVSLLPETLNRFADVAFSPTRPTAQTMASVQVDTTPEERATAAAMRTSEDTDGSRGDAGSAVAQDLDAVEIGTGRFKYVLIEVRTTNGIRHLVRGVPGASYHMDAARPTISTLEAAGASYTVLGGGRIEHDSDTKTISIYGHSYGFPWQGDCRHDISQTLCQSQFPGHTVTWSSEGY